MITKHCNHSLMRENYISFSYVKRRVYLKVTSNIKGYSIYTSLQIVLFSLSPKSKGSWKRESCYSHGPNNRNFRTFRHLFMHKLPNCLSRSKPSTQFILNVHCLSSKRRRGRIQIIYCNLDCMLCIIWVRFFLIWRWRYVGYEIWAEQLIFFCMKNYFIEFFNQKLLSIYVL